MSPGPGSVADLLAWSLTQPAVGRCLFCPEWSVSGTAQEVHELLNEHRASEHPEVVVTRRRRRSSVSLRKLSQSLSDQEQSEIDLERQRRMRLLGIERTSDQ